jgi:hypothetical protein
MTTAQWIFGIGLALCGIYIVVMNWVVFARGMMGLYAGSWVPLVGGGLGAVALTVLPVVSLRGYWWIPLLADWGSIPGLAHAAAWHLWRAVRLRK